MTNMTNTPYMFKDEWSSKGDRIKKCLDKLELGLKRGHASRAVYPPSDDPGKLFQPSAKLKAGILGVNPNALKNRTATKDAVLTAAWQMYALARWGSALIFETPSVAKTKVKTKVATLDGTTARKANIIGRLAKGEGVKAKVTWEGSLVPIPRAGVNVIRLPPASLPWNIDVAQSPERIHFWEVTLQSGIWNPFVNDAWILGGVHGGHDFIVLSPLSWTNFWNPASDKFPIIVTAREVLGLDKFGYKFKRHGGQLIVARPGASSRSRSTYETYFKLMKQIDKDIERHKPAPPRGESWVYGTQIYRTYKNFDRNVSIHVSSHLLVERKNKVVLTTAAEWYRDRQHEDQKKLLSDQELKKLEKELEDLERDGGLKTMDLRGANLHGVDLSSFQSSHGVRLNLSSACLSGAHLERANLVGADLQRANLEGADLRGADLTRADLRWAYLKNVQVTDRTILVRANLSGQDAFLQALPLDINKADVINAKGPLLLVRDSLEDNGSVTDSGGSASPDILARAQAVDDPRIRFGGTHWNLDDGNKVEFGQTNYFYIRIENVGIKAAESPWVHLYYAGFGASNWTHWKNIASRPLAAALPAGQRTVYGPIEWAPPANQSYCYMCYIGQSQKDLSKIRTMEENDVDGFVAVNPNVCWHNIETVNLDPSTKPFQLAFLLRGSGAGKSKTTYDLKVHETVDGRSEPEKTIYSTQLQPKGEQSIAVKIQPASSRIEVRPSNNDFSVTFNNSLALRFSQYRQGSDVCLGSSTFLFTRPPR